MTGGGPPPMQGPDSGMWPYGPAMPAYPMGSMNPASLVNAMNGLGIYDAGGSPPGPPSVAPYPAPMQSPYLPSATLHSTPPGIKYQGNVSVGSSGGAHSFDYSARSAPVPLHSREASIETTATSIPSQVGHSSEAKIEEASSSDAGYRTDVLAKSAPPSSGGQVDKNPLSKSESALGGGDAQRRGSQQTGKSLGLLRVGRPCVLPAPVLRRRRKLITWMPSLPIFALPSRPPTHTPAHTHSLSPPERH